MPAVLTDYPEARVAVPVGSDGSAYRPAENEATGWLFKCSAYGRPRPVIHWQVDSSNDEQVIYQSKAALSIKKKRTSIDRSFTFTSLLASARGGKSAETERLFRAARLTRVRADRFQLVGVETRASRARYFSRFACPAAQWAEAESIERASLFLSVCLSLFWSVFLLPLGHDRR